MFLQVGQVTKPSTPISISVNTKRSSVGRSKAVGRGWMVGERGEPPQRHKQKKKTTGKN